MKLHQLKIYGLFGHHDICLDLRVRPLFLVGPNGTGKSTCLAILHCILTAQWSRLTKLPFDHLECEFEDQVISLDADDCLFLSRFSVIFAPSQNRPRLVPLPPTFEEGKKFLRVTHPLVLDKDRFSKLSDRYHCLVRLFNFGISEDTQKVLFYPTYRRIERDLRELVDIDEEFGGVNVEQSVKSRFDSFGEVIGFGGQDIQRLIDSSAFQIENAARQALNEQSVRFIDVLNKRTTVRSAPLRDRVTDPATISKLVGRINTFAPGAVDTQLLEQNLSQLRRTNLGRITSKEEILIYYISELLQVLDRFERLAMPLSKFAEYMTIYLKPTKRAEFNERTFKIQILNADGNEVDLDLLSSGEKQILSLFSFLMFSDEPKGRILVIDEPELSLSVSWQKRLVSDLLSTKRPDVFVCATHSPFIFERFSLENVLSLGDL